MTRHVALILGCILFHVAGCDGPTERVLGDHGTQPETAITRLPAGELQDLEPIIACAKQSVATFADRVWPEPTQIVEQKEHWDVFFTYREKLVEVDGRQSVRKQLPAGCKVEVSKSDLVARLIPGR